MDWLLGHYCAGDFNKRLQHELAGWLVLCRWFQTDSGLAGWRLLCMWFQHRLQHRLAGCTFLCRWFQHGFNNGLADWTLLCRWFHNRFHNGLARWTLLCIVQVISTQPPWWIDCLDIIVQVISRLTPQRSGFLDTTLLCRWFQHYVHNGLVVWT